MRICLRALRHTPAPRRIGGPIYVANRPFSSTPIQWGPGPGKNQSRGREENEDDEDDAEIAELEQELHYEQTWSPELEATMRLQEHTVGRASTVLVNAQKVPKIFQNRTFWHDDEEDTDLHTDERNEDEFDEDDIMSMAHGKLEEFREHREYARIAAWEMPLLSKLARPFEPPTAQEPLRFRYTTYMGEFHPAEKKVVVEFSPKDLPLTEAQQLKLKKLLGPRFNPETEVAKMSCEQFEHQAQNKRYLGDLVDSLIKNAKDPTDMFEDIPLDVRHHKFKVKPKFPREWRMTEERRKFLEAERQKSLLLDQSKEEVGALINGKERIEQFFSSPRGEHGMADLVMARSLGSAQRGSQQAPSRRF